MARAYNIIRKKREGHALTKDEIWWFFSGYNRGDIPDYQVSALLMAILLKGMDNAETLHLTEVMARAGKALNLTDIPGPKVDKHSTGGVGDKVSLILAPLMASAGAVVPMMSGRGLGHTGGTLDKLESIPGFRSSLSSEEFRDILCQTGCAMIGFSDELAPLDSKLYALRDVTATVESVPLITGSIISKKLNEGIGGLALDVKTGSGAFMKDITGARTLAESLVRTGNAFGLKTVAVITDMSEPLGMTVGNALEVRETIDALKGKGPEDLMEVTCYLGAVMLKIAGLEEDITEGRVKLRKRIEDGSALKRFCEMVRLQGGNPDIISRASLLPHSCLSIEITSPREGYIESMDAEAIGTASMILGAGRETVDSVIDHSAGIRLHRKRGDYVKKDDLLCEFCTSDEASVTEAREIFQGAVALGYEPPEKRNLIIETIE
jgi:pyrimidine-nucleoside phosphorylase